VPVGIHGRDALTAYLKRLLARYPDWVWTPTESSPMRGGFVNLWRAEVPVGSHQLTIEGLCLVQLRDGLIARNQVFFDRSRLLETIQHQGEDGGRGTTRQPPSRVVDGFHRVR